MTAPTYPPSPYPPMPPPHGRPATVTIASALLFVVAVVQVVYGILTFTALSKAGEVYDEIAERFDADTEGRRASAIELALEGLYLARRIAKDSDGAETIYG